MEEYSIPQPNRWYCPSPSCGKWIPPKKLKRKSSAEKCPHCKTQICHLCRGLAHIDFADCPRDAGLEQTLEEAQLHGWRRCHQCQAMVELVSGCRHMTCKCGAQFCYTCGAVWPSCFCTEDDQRRREAELQARRFDIDGERELEAQELARALADIEQMEAQEAEERARQEEEERRLEEERQRREEEKAREQEAERLASIANAIRELGAALIHVNELQRALLNSRHLEEAESAHGKIANQQEEFDRKREKMEDALKSNLQQRIDALETAQVAEMQELISRQEEEEDDTFVSMSRHLKYKPNREERERSIMDKLKSAQEKERSTLESSHREATEEIEFKGGLEAKALDAGLIRQFEEESRMNVQTHKGLAERVISDRYWSLAAMRKRAELLERHRYLLIRGENATEDQIPERDLSHRSRQSEASIASRSNAATPPEYYADPASKPVQQPSLKALIANNRNKKANQSFMVINS